MTLYSYAVCGSVLTNKAVYVAVLLGTWMKKGRKSNFFDGRKAVILVPHKALVDKLSCNKCT